MKDFKNQKQQVITQRNNSKQLPPPLRDSAEQKYAGGIFLREVTQKGGGYTPSSRKAAFTSGYRRAAFTLAEILITLAVIGIVAVLTIPSMVKSHNERAWSTAKDVFSKRLDVAMKAMNTEGTLTGYTTTADFVNALKKNIKINQICTDDVTKCFVKKIQWRKYGDNIVDITKDNITFSTDEGQDWAETVGVRFANGVNALIAYNKNCTEDPYNNQYSPSANCIGIVYDVQANKKPNTYGKDINVNQNVSKIAGKGLCKYELTDGTCFGKILGGNINSSSEYPPLTKAECEARKNELGITVCYDNRDYWAGAVAACGHRNKLPNQEQLTKLAHELYNTERIADGTPLPIDKEKAAPFIAKAPYNGGFDVWSNEEDNNINNTYIQYHDYNFGTAYYSKERNYPGVILAICITD